MSAAQVPGFLDQMAASSRTRVAAAREREPDAALEARARAMPPAPRLKLDGRFDLIAELKLRSPALGTLGHHDDDLLGRVSAYARAGAAAVSVLTEPSRFDGELAHLERAAAALMPLGVPTMRKDFLVDPYQLHEARAAGAGGALLIVRMLDEGLLAGMLDCAARLGLFVLLEAFDAEDVRIARRVLAGWQPGMAPVLVGINSRDLQTLKVVAERLVELGPELPRNFPRVAESGLMTPVDAARMVRAGYDVALVGGALMGAPDPGGLVADMLAAGRKAAGA
jgi:indole-3-glycerol phosphate synthase